MWVLSYLTHVLTGGDKCEMLVLSHRESNKFLSSINQFATVRCGSCQMALMYPYGAPSVKCAVCHYITNVGTANGSGSVHRQNGVATSSTSTPVPNSQSQTVVVENPMSFDGSGKLVSNVVVGVTTEKK